MILPELVALFCPQVGNWQPVNADVLRRALLEPTSAPRPIEMHRITR